MSTGKKIAIAVPILFIIASVSSIVVTAVAG